MLSTLDCAHGARLLFSVGFDFACSEAVSIAADAAYIMFVFIAFPRRLLVSVRLISAEALCERALSFLHESVRALQRCH